MLYQKFQADHLFTGINTLGNDHVLITDEKGIVHDIVTVAEAGDDIQQLNGMLTPGFINCHCHLELSHMKGLIPEETGLVDFVYKVVTQRHFPEDEILAAIANAENEMIADGIVAVGDICNNLLTLHQKSKQKLSYYNFIEVSGWLPELATQRFERSLDFYNQFKTCLSGREVQNSKFKISLAPHASYSVSNELWELIAPYFQNKTTTIHNQETAFEDELFQNGTGDFMRMYGMMNMRTDFFKPTGKSSLQSILPGLKGASNVLLVHNTFIAEEDIAVLNLVSKQYHQQFFCCLCVKANTYIERTRPPIELMRKQNCNIVIGTDSLASNDRLSVLDEVKTIRQHFPFITSTELLQWATINGARALQMDERLGSFEKGKQPGVVLISNTHEGEITLASTANLVL